jgi:AsmA protein
VTRVNDTPPVFDLRFAVTGSWDEPIPLLDTQSLIERSPSAVPLLDAIKKRNSRETVPEVIDRITGGASGGTPPAAAPPAVEPATTAPSQNQ